jgi:D-arabinose 1-dehydrogenase-like Zn-dependent alcohol dehydrogenase
MRAAVVQRFGQPLVLESRPIPVPGPGQVAVQMIASGLCHTDIHAAHGDWPVKPTPPFVPGHEGIGTIYAIGRGVTSARVGDMVATPWLGYACGECKHCLTGWETLCLKQQNSGYSVDGCYAEYYLAQAAFASKVPAVCEDLRRVDRRGAPRQGQGAHRPAPIGHAQKLLDETTRAHVQRLRTAGACLVRAGQPSRTA